MIVHFLGNVELFMRDYIARLVYRMLRYGMQFVDRGALFYEARHRQHQINFLRRKAVKLGFQLVACAN